MNKKLRGSKSPGVLSGQVRGVSGMGMMKPNITQKRTPSITRGHMGGSKKRGY